MTASSAEDVPAPLEIPRLVITPSTPQDDPPIPYTVAGRRPTLARSQSLLEQIDTSTQSHRRKELLSPIVTTPVQVRRPGRGTAASLILIAMAFVLVLSSTLLGPETIAGLIHSEKVWMGKGHWKSDGRAKDVVFSTDGMRSEIPVDSSTAFDHIYDDIGSTIVDDLAHETAGPVMSHDSWRSYLRRREQVTGRAGPTAHLEAWDFH